jgi:hypothetical protein
VSGNGGEQWRNIQHTFSFCQKSFIIIFFEKMLSKQQQRQQQLHPEAVFLVVCDPSMNELCAI